jgi:predicted N-formylglutamate amidohydrolase
LTRRKRRSPARPAGSGRDILLLTCEHGGNRIPQAYRPLFRGAAAVLASHRGWDPGALLVARTLSARLRRPLHAVTWSRLLVESNRAPSNRRIWSTFTASLPRAERAAILERYWWPHRREVVAAVQREIARRGRVIHVAVHSFTPVLGREVRKADIGLLYDSRRPRERAFCLRWQAALREHAPQFRVRRNYPYSGLADGLPTWLRRRYRDAAYAGVELEINQALLAGPRRREVERALAGTLRLLF